MGERTQGMSTVSGPWLRRLVVPALVAAVCVYLIVLSSRYGLDLRVYRDSVSTWWSGRNPYLGSYTVHHLPFTYPPFALFALTPLSWGPFGWAHPVFGFLSIGAACGAVLIIRGDRAALRRGRAWWTALGWVCATVFLLEPMRSAIDYGQIEVVLMFVIVADLLVVPPPARGILLGLAAATKLTPLVFLLVFLVRGDWKSALRTLGAFLAATAAMWLVDPALSHTFWTKDVNAPGRTGPVAYPGNLSWYAIVHRWPFPTSGSSALWAVLCLVTLVVGTFLAWRCARTDRPSWTVVVVAFTGLMISPISWSHHWVFVLLVPPLLVGTRREPVPSGVRWMLWALVVLAVAAPYWWLNSGVAAACLQAVVPLWTGATLAAWALVEYSVMKQPGAGDRGLPVTNA